ncbi:MAG TPA: MoaD/ThiS family protein [Ktedonobacterales bacterium]
MSASTTPQQQLVLVHLPAELRDRTGQQATILLPGGSVRDIITALDAVYPGLRFNLCTEDGELRPFVNIFVNGRNVRFSAILDTPVASGSTVHILHSVAGG